MAMHLELLVFLLSWRTVASIAQVNQTQTKPGCQPKCGNITVPYPFGVGAKCSIAPWANINCNTTFNPPKPFIGDLEVMEFSLTEVRIKNYIATACYNQTGGLIASNYAWVNLLDTPYTFSPTKNKFTAIGCDTYVLASLNLGNYSSGCISLCNKKEDVIKGACSGMGCCQTSIPKGLKQFLVNVGTIYNYTRIGSFDSCGSAFLAEQDRYSFKISDFTNRSHLSDIPFVLNFAVGNQTCKRAIQDPATFACKGNSSCYGAVDGTGYLCHCSESYQGNPYLDQGCQVTVTNS